MKIRISISLVFWISNKVLSSFSADKEALLSKIKLLAHDQYNMLRRKTH